VQVSGSGEGFGAVRLAERRLEDIAKPGTAAWVDAEVARFMSYLEYEEMWNGPIKSRTQYYQDVEDQITLALGEGNRSRAKYLRDQLTATKKYDRSQSSDYMYGSDAMAAAHDRAKQQAAQVAGTLDQYTLHALSAIGDLNDGITYAINKDTYYSNFRQYEAAQRFDDQLMMVADPLVGLSAIFSNSYDPIVARMDRDQSRKNYYEYRTEGYNPDRDPGQGKGMLVTNALLDVAEPIAGELATEIFVGLRGLSRQGQHFATTLDSNRR